VVTQVGEWVPLPVACQQLGVGRERLRVAAYKGRIPYRKFGPHPNSPMLVRLEDARRYLDEVRAKGMGRPPKTSATDQRRGEAPAS
jgi:hypothetical protein